MAQLWETAVDKDTCDIYIQDPLKRDARGNSLGLSLVSSGNVGSFRETENYDNNSSTVGQTKEENLFTTNKWRWDPDSYSIPDQAVLHIHCADGSDCVMVVRGAQKTRRVIMRAEVPLTKYDKTFVVAA